MVLEKRAIVIGSGLAGLTTTARLLKSDFHVTLIEKTAALGYNSNSNKASSGINGVPTPQQLANGINDDTVELFTQDTIKSAQGSQRRNLIDELTSKSEDAIRWLSEDLKIDLSKVGRLGGHSKPRTHRGSGGLPPGYAIVSSLLKHIETFPQDKLTVVKNGRVIELLKKESQIEGIKYEVQEGVETLYCNFIVLATGGYSADFSATDSLLKKYKKEIIDLPSTNGPQTTGDGVKIAEKISAQLVDMDKVQIHPTGFVDPENPTDQWKILAGEILRGQGGILLNSKGERFVNELDTRDKVTEKIFSQDSPQTTLVVAEDSYDDLKMHLGFYTKKGLMKKGTVQELADDLNVPLSLIQQQLSTYNKAAAGELTDTYGRVSFGKEFSVNSDLNVFYGTVTPVLHFTMGGILIDEKGRALDTSNSIINGLYAVGEVSGGVHGYNRLGGNSLLECVVFGTAAAEDIVKQVM